MSELEWIGENYIHKMVWIYARQSTMSKDRRIPITYTSIYTHTYISMWVNWSGLEWIKYIIWCKCIHAKVPFWWITLTYVSMIPFMYISINTRTYIYLCKWIGWMEWITSINWYEYMHAKVPYRRIPIMNTSICTCTYIYLCEWIGVNWSEWSELHT